MKTVVITGGTKGIGSNIARMFLEKGYFVIVNYANSDKDAYVFKEENKDYAKNLYIIKSDLSTYEGLESLVSDIYKLKRNIDILILNAAITKREDFTEITYESWNKVMDTNLNIPFFITQKLDGKINNSGRVIFIGSVLGMQADGTSIQYGVSKGALNTLVKYLAKYFANRKITVNCINPGFIDTTWQINKSEEQRRRIENKTLLKRFGKVEEVTEICKMIESNDYLTGQQITIDGGYSI